MKSLWIDQKIKYDGSQLHTLYSYLNHKLLGNSVIAFRGPCDVSFSHMLDGEDLLDKSLIKGDEMLHFIIEVFDQTLLSGVFLQRLFASLVQDKIKQLSSQNLRTLVRSGDDLYWNDGKLSISIAAKSSQSVMIHFAINITNEGTPVKTASLSDLEIDISNFAKAVMDGFCLEYLSSVEASQKVKAIT